MSDPTGAAFGALLTAAARHQHIQEPAPSQECALKIVRLRMRQPPPRAVDLTCHETLPADPVPVIRPLARSVVVVPPAQLPPAPAPKAACQFDEKSVDNLYWSKHQALTNMMDGFASTLVHRLDQAEKPSLASASKADLLSAVVKEKRPPITPPTKLKTIADHQCLDDLIFVVCRMHTKVVNHAAKGGPSLYDVLGVPVDASDHALRRAYRKLALKHHPDRAVDKKPRGAAKKKQLDAATSDAMAQINAAYEILATPEKRTQYDDAYTAVMRARKRRFV